MAIQTFNIETCMGEITSFKEQLSFLTVEEKKEFNKIGYTGKNSAGVQSSYSEFLNSLDKGEFSVRQTKFDGGNFMEEFYIVRVVQTPVSAEI